ncbi:MAG: 4-hydroxybenzoate octaprenyltransferase [Paracoccaceae bacterium]|nr:4-hydroxybenzoate octaprenyltransferase [Paracoccaceae bacterium]
MSDTPERPIAENGALSPDGSVRDAVDRNWVDHLAPPWSRPYLRLARADRPIGTWLLLIPCWWGITLAILDSGWRWVDLWLFPATAIGAFVMRGAGCTWNDITDREIDGQVERTRSRPIPSGQVTVLQAIAFMIALGLVGLVILLTLNSAAIWLGVISLLPVCIYPFAKRFTWWPQLFLGIAFNWGALLGWAAHDGGLSLPPIYLYLAGIAWTLHYDTIYAHQDREDDELIGVRSTARLFDQDTGWWLWLFTGLTVVLALMAVLFAKGGWIALLGPLGLGGFMAWQIRELDIDDPDQCLRLFRATRFGGFLMLGCLLIDAIF